MKKFLNKILRNDLDLNKNWWHRLSKVVFLIVIIASVVISAYVTYKNNEWWHSKPYRKDYVEITSTLSDYISKHSKEGLMELDEIFNRYGDAFVIDYGSFEHKEYKIGDIIEKEYDYSYGYEYADWVLGENYNNKKYLKKCNAKSEWWLMMG